MSFAGFVVNPASPPSSSMGALSVSAPLGAAKQVGSSGASGRANSKSQSPSPTPSPQASLVAPPVRSPVPPFPAPTASASFASQLIAATTNPRAQVRSSSPQAALSQQSGALSPRMSTRAAAAVALQNLTAAEEVPAPALPVHQSLEPVQEEQDTSPQASTWTPSVQELKEQLLAERAWWSSTSAAQVTQELAREREERSRAMQTLRNELKTQQVTLAQVARYLLGEKVTITEIDTATPQVVELEAMLRELRTTVAEQQQNQELQANALREGLMSIHAQQASMISVPSAEVETLSASVDALHTFVNERIEALGKEIALERQARQVREAREAREGVGSFTTSGGAQLDTQRQELDRLRAEFTQELDKHRHDISEAARLASRKDLTEMRAVTDGPGAKALELHAQLAEELADVIRRCEQQRADMAQAIDEERMARITEATDLRTSIETSVAVDRASAGLAPETLQAPPSKIDGMVQAMREIAEERASRSRETAESKAYTESMVRKVLDKAEALEQKFVSASREWETRSAVDSQSATQVAAQAAAREYGAEVQNLIRESQDMMRYEFSARISELELKMRRHLDLGGAPLPPQSDAEELSCRLEAIKAQLNAEIKKRLERTPGSLLAVGSGEQSSTFTVKGTLQEQLQQAAVEASQVTG